MPSKFEQMRHRENRRIRQAFDGHLINRKIRNDHFKFAENFNDMRHRENRRIRNRNWDPANAKGFFTKTIPSIFNSATNGLLGGGGRGGVEDHQVHNEWKEAQKVWVLTAAGRDREE